MSSGSRAPERMGGFRVPECVGGFRVPECVGGFRVAGVLVRGADGRGPEGSGGRGGAAAEPADPGSPHGWCVTAVALLDADQPEAALAAARRALALDPRLEWAHRVASLAQERLGRDGEAVSSAEHAVRLAPGSWAARLRLGTALRRLPGRWRESWTQAAKAVWFAPEEPDAHVLAGDLALTRGDHDRAGHAYRAALRGAPDHPAARVNLGLTLLRWERPRAHHDPAWAVDPRETGRARRAIEVWSRQVRVLLALALAAVTALAFGVESRTHAQLAGAVLLLLAVPPTVRQARRVRIWSYVPQILGRDLWLSVAACLTPLVVVGYAAAVLTLPGRSPDGGAALWHGGAAGVVWAGTSGLVVFNGLAVAFLRVLVEAWRGRPVPALAQFAAAFPERTARRDANVALWIVVVRAWSVLALVAVVAPVAGPVLALAAPAVPLALWRVARRGRLAAHLREVPAQDRPLVAAVLSLLLASAALALTGAEQALRDAAGPSAPAVAAWGWRAGLGALACAVVVFAARAARAWWRGAPGPWRASLLMCEGRGSRPPGDVRPSVGLSEAVRRAFTSSRGVVLAYADAGGPRALAVGAVTSIGPAGELRLIAADEAWQAAERDPKVAVFVADPIGRRFWAEVRGVALGDPEAEVLRVTPKQVVIGEYPGRHQARRR
ncbi:hypothetical protein Misp01_30880 [Microtetraspora sp. NBRC 13810]|uniref:tetratricopeptide repeat protein n=1 Tax=Microtetraspora sp. NBRC 13810 TaxID=3030990 RepID=UPI0024A55258|nr:hypothetical protein [Microtetraspora sp. NBRC 13810]GLW07958.1 hypothetical protein Misp01_30880 [Microtetraspora sp. NBRC 13810]